MIMLVGTNTITFCLTAIFLGLLTFILWFYRKAFSYWKTRGLEYLEPIIPFGNAINVYLRRCTLGELFAQQYLEIKKKGLKHAGTYYFWTPIYIPSDENIIKRIIISDFEYFPNHGFYISEANDPLSGHIFNMEDGKWKNFRAKTPSAFTSAKMRHMFHMMEELSNQFNKNLDSYASTGTTVDIKNELSRFTTDIISACAFGIDTNTMKRENEELLEKGRSFFDYQWSLVRNTIVLVVPRPILQKFNFRIMKKDTETYMTNMYQKITDYRKEKGVVNGDLTDLLMRLTERHEDERDVTGKNIIEPLNLGEFTAQMFVFFAAGFETSSSTQAFALYELATNPHCQTKLREEIKTVLEKHDNNLTYDAVMEMEYLDKVVDETLRLYPVFPILPRVCVKDYKVEGTDVTIEKNTQVIVSNMGIQRDPEYWPNPNQFDPERFSKEEKAKRPHIAYMPFGEGQRICVGKRFGLLQTKIGLITTVRNYEITLNEKTTTPFKFVHSELILRKSGDIWVNLKKIYT